MSAAYVVKSAPDKLLHAMLRYVDELLCYARCYMIRYVCYGAACAKIYVAREKMAMRRQAEIAKALGVEAAGSGAKAREVARMMMALRVRRSMMRQVMAGTAGRGEHRLR